DYRKKVFPQYASKSETSVPSRSPRQDDWCSGRNFIIDIIIDRHAVEILGRNSDGRYDCRFRTRSHCSSVCTGDPLRTDSGTMECHLVVVITADGLYPFRKFCL